jgi:hypothetical protein
VLKQQQALLRHQREESERDFILEHDDMPGL